MFKFKYGIYFVFLFFSQSLHALTVLNVSLSTDNDPGGFGENGDLRYCLNTMNQNLSTMQDNYAIVFETPMTIQLNGILPIINTSSYAVDITIGNPGTIPTVTIDGNNGSYSGFFIPMGNVTIQNMIFQNLAAQGGHGGDGISGGGGGMGAGAAIYSPQSFLYGSNPSVTLKNVLINNCTAIGGDGGSYVTGSTGNEGGGGGGGFSGNGGSIIALGVTGGAGGGGFGGSGGDVVSADGGGGGGGGIGSRANIGTLTNLGDGGSNQSAGSDGNVYGPTIIAGAGGGGYAGGNQAGGGGGGGSLGSFLPFGGGGGGSFGADGLIAKGNIPAHRPPFLSSAVPSGGYGGDGAGGGGGGIVQTDTTNEIDGQAGNGGYGGGGGGGAGTGARDIDYTVKAGSGGVGGGGGGGGVNQSGSTPANGGDSLGGGGGGGGGPSNMITASGGIDEGQLGGGAGGDGGAYGDGGGGGGGGSALGAAIFVDSYLNFTIQAISGTPTSFNTTNNTIQAGLGGAGASGASSGANGTALGTSIFLRTESSLTFLAQDVGDVLTLGEGVSFVDDTVFGTSGTRVFVRGNGSVIYQGTTDYLGAVMVNNANFKVNGLIDEASISVCRDSNFSQQRGVLSGSGTLTGNVLVNSGTISPDIGQTLTLGSLTLNPVAPGFLGSLVHSEINSGGASLVAVNGAASLAGALEINIDSTAQTGEYILLTSSGITGTFDEIKFTGATPNYTLSYLPVGAPTYVQFNFLGYPSTAVDIPATVNGSTILNPAVICCGRPVILGPLPIGGTGPTIYRVINQTGNVSCQIKQTSSQTYLKMYGKNGSCTIVGTKDGVDSNPLTIIAS